MKIIIDDTGDRPDNVGKITWEISAFLEMAIKRTAEILAKKSGNTVEDMEKTMIGLMQDHLASFMYLISGSQADDQKWLQAEQIVSESITNLTRELSNL